MIKSKLLAIGFILTAFFVNGQERNFSIGMIGSADINSYHALKAPNEATAHDFSAGLRIQYYFSERLSLKYGMLYCSMRYSDMWRIPAGEGNYESKPTDLDVAYIAYIKNPLLVSYNFIKKEKLSIYSSLGIEPNYFIKTNKMIRNDLREVNGDSAKWYESQLSTFFVSPMLDFGVNYKLNPSISLSIESYYKFGLKEFIVNPFGSEDIDGSYLEGPRSISYGLVIGIHYNFKSKAKPKIDLNEMPIDTESIHKI